MLRMTEREEREKCVETKRQKKGDLICLFIYSFATYATCPFPRLPDQVCVARCRERQLRFTLFRDLPSVNRISYHKFVIQVF